MEVEAIRAENCYLKRIHSTQAPETSNENIVSNIWDEIRPSAYLKYISFEIGNWKVSETTWIGKCQNWKVSVTAHIGNCQKLLTLEIVRNCPDWKVSEIAQIGKCQNWKASETGQIGKCQKLISNGEILGVPTGFWCPKSFFNLPTPGPQSLN